MIQVAPAETNTPATTLHTPAADNFAPDNFASDSFTSDKGSTEVNKLWSSVTIASIDAKISSMRQNYEHLGSVATDLLDALEDVVDVCLHEKRTKGVASMFDASRAVANVESTLRKEDTSR